MKIVVNRDYGGFSIPTALLGLLGEDSPYDDEPRIRCHPILVAFVERYRLNDDNDSSLVVVNIPDEATDWKITEYVGMETLHYVIDGKIRSITPGYDEFNIEEEEDVDDV